MATITCNPGDNLATALSGASNGDVLLLNAGTYPITSTLTTTGKNGITIRGIRYGDVIITGFLDVKSLTWVSSGSHFYADLPSTFVWRGTGGGDADASAPPRVLYPNRLEVNGEWWEHHGSTAQVEAGANRYFIDNTVGSYGRIYASENLSGKTTARVTNRRDFIYGSGTNIRIQNLIVEGFSSSDQEGAINRENASGWDLTDCTIRYCAGGGIEFGDDMRVHRCRFEYNAHVNYTTGTESGLERIDMTRTYQYRSNYAVGGQAMYNIGWEAGNKAALLRYFLWYKNKAEQINSKGFWWDIDNLFGGIIENISVDNRVRGFYYEISHAAALLNNYAANNGSVTNWLWDAGITSATSQQVEIAGNVLISPATVGHGLGVVNQNRGSSGAGLNTWGYPEWYARYLSVHDNDIYFSDVSGSHEPSTGIATDYLTATAWTPGHADYMYPSYENNRHYVKSGRTGRTRYFGENTENTITNFNNFDWASGNTEEVFDAPPAEPTFDIYEAVPYIERLEVAVNCGSSAITNVWQGTDYEADTTYLMAGHAVSTTQAIAKEDVRFDNAGEVGGVEWHTRTIDSIYTSVREGRFDAGSNYGLRYENIPVTNGADYILRVYPAHSDNTNRVYNLKIDGVTVVTGWDYSSETGVTNNRAGVIEYEFTASGTSIDIDLITANSQNAALMAFTLNRKYAAPSLASLTASGTINNALDTTITVTAGDNDKVDGNIYLKSGSLPAGVTYEKTSDGDLRLFGTPTETGVFTPTFFVAGKDGEASTQQVTMTIATNAEEIVVRVNAGGPAVAANDGGIGWDVDTSPGSIYQNPTGTANGTSNSTTAGVLADLAYSDDSVPARFPVAMYPTKRSNAQTGTSPLAQKWVMNATAHGLNFDDGDRMRIVCLFGESFFQSVGQRVFNMQVNGVFVQTIDSIAIVGQRYLLYAVEHKFTLDGTDVVALDLVNVTNNPELWGLELARINRPPVVADPGNLSGTQGISFSQQITATDPDTEDTITEWEATGLPSGLSISPSGMISGTPTEHGTFNVTVTATDSGGAGDETDKLSGSQSFDIVVTGNIAIDFIASTSQAYDVTLQSSASVAIDFIASTSQAYDVELQPGAVNLSIPFISSTSEAYDVQALTDNEVGIDFIPSTSQAFDVSLVPGAVSLDIPFIEATSQAYRVNVYDPAAVVPTLIPPMIENFTGEISEMPYFATIESMTVNLDIEDGAQSLSDLGFTMTNVKVARITVGDEDLMYLTNGSDPVPSPLASVSGHYMRAGHETTIAGAADCAALKIIPVARETRVTITTYEEEV